MFGCFTIAQCRPGISALIIIIIRTFVTRAVSANILNLRRRQSLGEEDGVLRHRPRSYKSEIVEKYSYRHTKNGRTDENFFDD